MTPEEYARAEKYLSAVKAVAREAGNYLSEDSLKIVHHLIAHTEPAEGMCYLGWAIVRDKVQVPAHLIDSIYEFTAGMVDVESMPPNLRDFAVPATND